MSPFAEHRQMLRRIQPVGLAGRVRAIRGLTVGVADFPAPVGAACRIAPGRGGVEGRVIGFAGAETLVMPLGCVEGVCRGDRVECGVGGQTVGVSPEMLGRLVDGLGRPIDGQGPVGIDRRMPIWPGPLGAMERRRITEPLPTGVRAMDAMLTSGRGQRMGIFSGSGVGKSVLLGMIGRYTAADVTVIALIGERGREVRDFLERDLGPEGLKRAVVVVSTGDEPPLLRVQGGAVAVAVAEYFRDQGKDVLLLMDSLTRLAMAQRQIGLAAGEPSASRGYTPSVFALLPQLLERCGRTRAGSITGFFTVLMEGDDAADPLGDAVRAATDGHVWLSRGLAQRGHFPAVDVLQSVSRVMADVAGEDHRQAAREVQALIAVHREIEDMVAVGAYRKGSSAEHDLAVNMMPILRAFLAQPTDVRTEFASTVRGLIDLREQVVGARRQLARATHDGLRAGWR